MRNSHAVATFRIDLTFYCVNIANCLWHYMRNKTIIPCWSESWIYLSDDDLDILRNALVESWIYKAWKKVQWDTGQVNMEQRNSFTRLCATDKTRFLDYSDKADIMTADSMSNSGCVMYRMTSYNHQYNIEYSLIDRILSTVFYEWNCTSCDCHTKCHVFLIIITWTGVWWSRLSMRQLYAYM